MIPINRMALLLILTLMALSGLMAVELSPQPPRNNAVEQAAERPQQYIDSRSPEQRLADYTLWLERFTAALVIVSAVQILFLIRSDSTARTAANAAKEIGEKQLSLAGLHADIAEKQKEIDRLNYFAEYRPKIEIRFVKKLDARANLPPDEQPTRVEFVVINAGAGEAAVIGSRVTLDWLYQEDIPIPTDLWGSDLIPKRRYLPGATDKATVESDQWGGLNEFFGDGRKKLYLLGWVVYFDGRGEEFGTRRTTYFGRQFDAELRLFQPIRHLPDWELTL